MWATVDCCPHLFSYRSELLSVILDCQLGALWQMVIIATKESDVVRTHVIVIVSLEFKADLCDAIQVDVLESRTVQPGVIPAAQGIIFDQANRILVRGALKV